MTAIENLPESPISVSKTLNQWIREAKSRPVPNYLFGEYWLEGELAVLCADTGMGKSVLALQIAESIARGEDIIPLDMTAKPQRVLYFDFELTAKQIEMRYAREHISDKGTQFRNHYRFSDKLHRVEVDPNCALPDGFRSFDEYFVGLVAASVRRTGAKIVIIDNLTQLKRSYSSTKDSIRVMNELNRLKKRFGLSVLVVAHTRGRSGTQLGGDLQCSRVLASLADSVFAIGPCTGDAGGRYFKHIKTRSTEMVYDESYAPSFRISKLGGNFLGFEFDTFGDESEFAKPVKEYDGYFAEKIYRLSEQGLSIRKIAKELGISKSTVHRIMHAWDPPEEEPERVPKPVFYGRDRCTYNKCSGCDFCGGRPANQWREQPGTVLIGHRDNGCPDDCPVCGPRVYAADDLSADPALKAASDKMFRELREWLAAGQKWERPVYVGPARSGMLPEERGQSPPS